jgi:hypothetical protein
MHRLTQAEWEEMHRDFSHGNEDALRFNSAWCGFCHALDDVVDGEPIDAEAFISEMLEALQVFAGNAFFQQHKHELLPLIIQSANAFLDSHRWEMSENALERQHANVLRIFYDCVVDHVAYITSGYDFNRLRYLSKKWRDRIWQEVNSPDASPTLEPWIKNGEEKVSDIRVVNTH